MVFWCLIADVASRVNRFVTFLVRFGQKRKRQRISVTWTWHIALFNEATTRVSWVFLFSAIWNVPFSIKKYVYKSVSARPNCVHNCYWLHFICNKSKIEIDMKKLKQSSEKQRHDLLVKRKLLSKRSFYKRGLVGLIVTYLIFNYI